MVLRNNLLRCACAIFSLLSSTAPAAAIEHNQGSVKALSKAYGFVLGQNYTLQRIRVAYPHAALQVEQARLAFNAAFPDIQDKLERELVSAITEQKFRELKREINKKITDTVAVQQITPQTAEGFLETVKARSKGNDIEEDVLRYLLAVRYASNPVGEYVDGFRQRYRTDGTGKSQGIKVALQVPRSWLAKDGERPHIVKKWLSEGGTGKYVLHLDFRGAEGYEPSRQEIERSVKNGELRDFVPEGGVFHNGGSFSVEGRPGYWIDMSINLERIGYRMYERAYMYQFFFRGKAIGIMCTSIDTEENSKIADAAAALNKPLCLQVINSIVLEQKYGD